MAERSGPEGSDDLFEDLDKFFNSIDDEEWPEPLEAPAAPRDEPHPQEAPPTAAAVEAGAAPPPDDVEEAPIPEPEPPRSFEPEPPPRFEPEPSRSYDPEPPPSFEPPTPEPTSPLGAGRREVSGEDWSRLRDVLGEGDDEAALDAPAPPESPTEESLFGYPGRGSEAGGQASAMSGTWETGGESEDEREPGELTLDDLKKAPPQYRDLPGPRDEEPPPRRPVGPPPRFEDPASESEPDLGPDPSLADIGAAAGRVAGSFSDDEPLDEPAGTTGSFDEGTGFGGNRESWFPGELSDEAGEVPGPVEDDLLADLAEPRGPRRVKVGEPESLLGPAWEDPTARTVGAEPRGPRITGRNIPVAVASAVVLAVVALIALAWKPAAFSVVAGAVVLLAQYELYRTAERRGYHPAHFLGGILGGLALAGAYFKGEAGMTFILALGVVLTFLWYMSAPPKARSGSLANMGVTLLGLVYVPFLAGFVLLILTEAASGRALMLAVIGLTFLYDVSAFFAGSFYGSRPLAPTISPKKSWEGLLVATVLTFAISLAFVSRLGPMDAPKALGLALVIVIFAPLGDLAESAIKRDLGVKDMGTIMPGHGGLLDRIDSVLFVAPAAFYFLRLVF